MQMVRQMQRLASQLRKPALGHEHRQQDQGSRRQGSRQQGNHQRKAQVKKVIQETKIMEARVASSLVASSLQLPRNGSLECRREPKQNRRGWFQGSQWQR